MIHDPIRLQELLEKPALGRIMNRLRRRLRHGRDLDSVMTFSDLSSEERSAIDRLLGRRPSSGTATSVRPREVERILREGDVCDSLEEALTHAFGPVLNERLSREAARQQWDDLHASVAQQLSDLPSYHDWLDGLFSTGRLKRWCRGDCVLAQRMMDVAATVLRGIPWPVISLADLATRLTNDSHALDRGLALPRLCLSAIKTQHPLKDHDPSRRQLWEWAGVVIDELSAPVLVLNLRADPATLLGQTINTLAEAGEPFHLSVRLLRLAGAGAFQAMSGQVVYACENPTVVATAARRLGSTSRPLICTSGQPASAAQLLLSQLRDVGCRVLYHGDFDNAGITIANLLIRRFGVEPWRMSSEDYAASMTKGPVLTNCVAASWDQHLSGLLVAAGRAVLEESVLDLLIEDLSK